MEPHGKRTGSLRRLCYLVEPFDDVVLAVFRCAAVCHPPLAVSTGDSGALKVRSEREAGQHKVLDSLGLL